MKNIKTYMTQSKAERQEHLSLDEPCLERGGNSTCHRGVLAQYLDTEIPMGRKAILAHACNNGKCSNPRHLYWATDYENIVEDGTKFGTFGGNPWLATVAKYGLEGARAINAKGDKAASGRGNKGKPKSAEHRAKIAEGVRKKHQQRGVDKS